MTNNFLGSGRRGDGKIFVEVESFIGFRKETAQASILTDTMGAFQTEEFSTVKALLDLLFLQSLGNAQRTLCGQ